MSFSAEIHNRNVTIDALTRQRAALKKALRNLADQCDHVPVFQLDDGKATVKAIRMAGKFMKALDEARTALKEAA